MGDLKVSGWGYLVPGYQGEPGCHDDDDTGKLGLCQLQPEQDCEGEGSLDGGYETDGFVVDQTKHVSMLPHPL